MDDEPGRETRDGVEAAEPTADGGIDGGGGGVEAATMVDLLVTLRALAHRREYLILPSTGLEMPEAIFHPAIFESLVGEDPRSIALEQPVYRPLDGRGVEHPIRSARYLEWSVVLRRRLGEAQELALEVLYLAGIEPREHDVRFRDRSWRSKALDARGEGWRLEVDGLAVASLCAIDRFAGLEPSHPTLALTVGVERLAMAASGVDRLARVAWSPSGPERGGLVGRELAELDRWSEEAADADMLARRLEEGIATAHRALEAGLPRIAYRHGVATLVPLDQLALRGLLSLRERERQLETVCEVVTAAARLWGGDVAPTPDGGEVRAADSTGKGEPEPAPGSEAGTASPSADEKSVETTIDEPPPKLEAAVEAADDGRPKGKAKGSRKGSKGGGRG